VAGVKLTIHLEGQVYEYVAVYPHSWHTQGHLYLDILCVITEQDYQIIYHRSMNIVCKPSNHKCNMLWSFPIMFICKADTVFY